MAIDFVHSEEIVDAVIAVLTNQLPDGWVVPNGVEVELKCLQHGDLSDFTPNEIRELIPAILVKSLGINQLKMELSGMQQTSEIFRVVMIRDFDQCVDENGLQIKNFARQRYYYTKQLNAALFSDPQRRLCTFDEITGAREDVTLTCTDTNGAQIIKMNFRSWDFEGSTPEVNTIKNLQSKLWAVACDFEVIIRTG